MLFQRPNPFPMSIRDNVVAGVKAHRIAKGKQLDVIAERRLTEVGLWDAVKDRLNDSPFRLSGGQQQLLCLARALAVGPEVLLLDEPTSSLDPISTESIEALLRELAPALTLIVVTHNLGQAMRVSHNTMFFYQGRLVEHGSTERSSRPREEPTPRATSTAAWASRPLTDWPDTVLQRPPTPEASTHRCIASDTIATLNNIKEEPCDSECSRARPRCVPAIVVAGRHRPWPSWAGSPLPPSAGATVKLPKSGVETPPTASLSETGSTLLYPLWNLWAAGYSQKYPQVTDPDGRHGLGHGHHRRHQRHGRHRRLRRLPLAERGAGHARR